MWWWSCKIITIQGGYPSTSLFGDLLLCELSFTFPSGHIFRLLDNTIMQRPNLLVTMPCASSCLLFLFAIFCFFLNSSCFAIFSFLSYYCFIIFVSKAIFLNPFEICHCPMLMFLPISLLLMMMVMILSMQDDWDHLLSYVELTSQ